MQRYIARQPIFDRAMRVTGYELLYRAGDEDGARIVDGDRATQSLLSDVMMVFGLRELTDGRPAFVNFTEKLLLNDFVLMVNPRQVTIEILESVRVSERLVRRLRELKERGYRLALDDYTGDPALDPFLPMIDVLKVDFLLTDEKTQERIAAKHRRGRIRLLAEKVEDKETFDRAAQMGYQEFQGYFFERPTRLNKSTPDVNAAAYIRLLRELNEPDVNLMLCAEIIRTDADLTFRLLKTVQTMRYYRGSFIKAVEQAVVSLGIDELYHWLLLVLARGINRTYSDETVREAYLRGIFAERLMERSRHSAKKSLGFVVGMFSLMDRIMDRDIEEILKDVNMPEEVVDAILGRGKNILSQFLNFIIAYEQKRFERVSGLELAPEEIVNIYVSCIKETDQAFRLGE